MELQSRPDHEVPLAPHAGGSFSTEAAPGSELSDAQDAAAALAGADDGKLRCACSVPSNPHKACWRTVSWQSLQLSLYGFGKARQRTHGWAVALGQLLAVLLGAAVGRAAPWWSLGGFTDRLESLSFSSVIGGADTTTAVLLWGALLSCSALLIAVVLLARQGGSYWSLFLLSAQIVYCAAFSASRGLTNVQGDAAASLGIVLDSDESIRFGDMHLSPEAMCCDATQRSWVQQHDTHHCVAPECLGFFVANQDWADRGLADNDVGVAIMGFFLGAPWLNSCAAYAGVFDANADTGCEADFIKASPNCDTGCQADPLNLQRLCPLTCGVNTMGDAEHGVKPRGGPWKPALDTNRLTIDSWTCDGGVGIPAHGGWQAALGGRKVAWDDFSLSPCQVKVSNHTAQQEFSLQMPRMCTPSYFCHRLNKDDWEDDREWETLIVTWNVISFVSAVFERFLALRLFLRAGETEVTERTVASARALSVQLWVPGLYYMFLVSDGGIVTQFNGISVLQGIATMMSLGATALLMRAQCLVHEEAVDKIIRDLLATPAAEQDAEAVLRSLRDEADALRASSRRWSPVLKVQLVITVAEQTFLLATLISHGGNTIFDVVSCPVFSLWPLALTFRAIGSLNFSLDAVPHKVVRGAVFTLESRAAFIEDYQRLGMHLNIWGWEVTTTRITVALVALVVPVVYYMPVPALKLVAILSVLWALPGQDS